MYLVDLATLTASISFFTTAAVALIKSEKGCQQSAWPKCYPQCGETVLSAILAVLDGKMQKFFVKRNVLLCHQ